MSNEQKYYTPSHEDFRAGFEFEYNYLKEGWTKEVFDGLGERDFGSYGHLYASLKGHPWEDHIRVPYLTAEQIEDEGWVKKGDQADFLFGDGDEEHYTMHHSVAFNEVVINKHSFDEYTSSMRKQLVYFGTCRCVNDLRTISKLLGI